MYQLCLNMIVKDEAHIIHETLNSIYKYIDYWVISDTGSTDGTQDVIRKFFNEKNIPGELFQDEWKNFGHNRSLAMKHAYNKSKYLLVIDADDLISGELVIPSSDADVFQMQLSDNVVYYRPQIFKNTLKWGYRGILHEFAYCINKKNAIAEKLTGCKMISRRLGSRSRDSQKYQKDALLLVKAIEENTEPDLYNRYCFYAGQSFRDCNDHANAIKYYQMRADAGGWNEEVFYSYLMVGIQMKKLNYPKADIMRSFFNAYKANPDRSESLFQIVLMNIADEDFEKAYNTMKMVLNIPYPAKQVLFIDKGIYEYGALFNMGIICKNLNKHDELLDIYHKLQKPSIPDDPKNKIKIILSEYIEKEKIQSSCNKIRYGVFTSSRIKFILCATPFWYLFLTYTSKKG